MLSYQEQFGEALRVLDEIAKAPWPEGVAEAEAGLFPEFIEAVVQVADEAGVEFDVLVAIDYLRHDLERDGPA